MEQLSKDEIQQITSILELLIPATNGVVPGPEIVLKKDREFESVFQRFAHISKVLCKDISEDEITIENLERFKKENFRIFADFVNLALILYYSDQDVLMQMNVGSVPPFPEGNFVKEGDIYLLEQVFLKDKLYKD